jgi:hypothetical protein
MKSAGGYGGTVEDDYARGRKWSARGSHHYQDQQKIQSSRIGIYIWYDLREHRPFMAVKIELVLSPKCAYVVDEGLLYFYHLA